MMVQRCNSAQHVTPNSILQHDFFLDYGMERNMYLKAESLLDELNAWVCPPQDHLSGQRSLHACTSVYFAGTRLCAVAAGTLLVNTPHPLPLDCALYLRVH
jgi:hypothetical protein